MMEHEAEMRPVLLLTRPAPAAHDFAAALADLRLRVVISPLIVVDPVAVPRTVPMPRGLVFTSINGVEHGAKLGLPPGLPAWCVGDATARAARAAGFDARSAGADAGALVARILADRPAGPLLHPHGEHLRADISAALRAAGLPCTGVVVYRQSARALSDAAQSVLAGQRPVVAPLFSPRTAALLAAGGPVRSPLHLVAMSAAVAAEARLLHPASVILAESMDLPAMIAATRDAVARIGGND